VDSADEEIGKPVAEFFGVTIDKPKVIRFCFALPHILLTPDHFEDGNHVHFTVDQAVAFTVTDEQPVKYLFEDKITTEKIKVRHSISKNYSYSHTHVISSLFCLSVHIRNL
jgi:hypothetical protein